MVFLILKQIWLNFVLNFVQYQFLKNENFCNGKLSKKTANKYTLFFDITIFHSTRFLLDQNFEKWDLIRGFFRWKIYKRLGREKSLKAVSSCLIQSE
jgi:hypothetical protein